MENNRDSKIKYDVTIYFYQYNSGTADNGNYVHVFDFTDIEKAKQLKRIVDLSYHANKDKKYDTFTYNFGQKLTEYISFGGFLNREATITEITTKQL